VHFTVEVKKAEQTMLLYGVVSESAVTVTEVALQAADGTEKSAYDAQRLDDEGQEKFRLYLSSLGVNDSFVPAAYAAAHLHDEHGTTPHAFCFSPPPSQTPINARADTRACVCFITAYHKWVKDVMAFTKQ
jgi:hypothetical protein